VDAGLRAERFSGRNKAFASQREGLGAGDYPGRQANASSTRKKIRGVKGRRWVVTR